MNGNNHELITLPDFTRIVKWYEFSDNIKKILKENIKNANRKEYYFISSQWINDFKVIFQYESLKKKINIFKKNNNNQNPLNTKEIEYIYQQIKNNTLISLEQKKKLKIIPNNNIIQRDLYVNENCIIKNYYNNFILIDKQILNEFKPEYKIGELIKFDILLGSGIFIISLNNNVIEVGIFTENIYKYDLFLFIFADLNEQEDELERIKKEGISHFFKYYNLKKEQITIENIRKSNGKEMIIINISNYQNNKSKMPNEYNNNKKTMVLNELDLSKKRGLVAFDKDCSRLNSIIQLLTSIREIRDFLFINKEIIINSKNYYIISSTLINIFEQLYNKGETKENNVETLNHILNNNNPVKGPIPLDQYLLLILDKLHIELNLSPKKQTNKINLKSFESPANTEEKTYNIFDEYYREYYQSIIAKNFNWKRKKNYMCTRCNSSLYSLQAFPYIEFNLDETHEYTIFQNTEYKKIYNDYKDNKDLLKQKYSEYKNKKLSIPIHITDCFKFYLDHKESTDIKCNYCNQSTQNICRNCIYQTPKYFCIILNRKKTNGIKITLSDELKLENYIDDIKNEYKKYKLLGILAYNQINETNRHYYAILRNFGQSWLIFDDDKISKVENEKMIYESNSNARLLLYMGVKY